MVMLESDSDQPRRVGSWRSPVTTADAAQTVGLRTVAVEPTGAVWWLRTGPADGRCRLNRSDLAGPVSKLPGVEPAEAVPVPGGAVVFGRRDSRPYLLRATGAAKPLTGEPVDERYTDPVLGPDGRAVWCVLESVRTRTPAWSLVAVPVDGSGTVRTLLSSTVPLSSPRPSPDGAMLAWVEWDSPQMPWDASRLRVGQLTAGVVTRAWTLLGGAVESVFQPEWASATSLYVVSDRTRWWNLYEVGLDGTLRALYLAPEEFGWPQRGPGLATYGQLADGRLAVLHGCGTWRLDLLDTSDGTMMPLDLPYTAWQPTLRTAGSMIAGVAGAPTRAAEVVVVDADSARHHVVRRSFDEPTAGFLPVCRPTTFAASDGHQVPVTVFPPRNPGYRPEPGARVPYLLFLPDGPGTQADRMFDPVKVVFTSRGFGVAVVEVRGSSGYGRRYREQVYGRWGLADVEDCATAARGLVQHWGADPEVLIVRGRGAGATLALEALANTDLFAAATVYAPITDLAGLPAEGTYATADYLKTIAADSAAPRTATWTARVGRPVLMQHGTADTTVPNAQSQLLRDALRAHGVPHTHLTFPDEDHTFRRADNISRALEAELSFYRTLLGRAPDRPDAGARYILTGVGWPQQ